MVVWPPELGGLLISGFTRTVPEGRLRTRMQSGHVQARRVVALAVAQANVSCMFNVEQISRFRTFWQSDTGGGVEPFLLPDQQLDGSEVWTGQGGSSGLLTEAGVQIAAQTYWVCLFGDATPSEAAQTDRLYQLAFQLDIHPF